MASSLLPPTSAFSCSTCSATFSRREHLQRHLLSHSSDRCFHCIFCEQSFYRRDVLKRHWTSCRQRIDAHVDIPTLSQQVRGKKRKSCDRCVRLKRACDLKKPCRTCVTRNEECSYNRVAHRGPPSSSATNLSPPRRQTLEDLVPDTGLEGHQGPIENQFDRTITASPIDALFIPEEQATWNPITRLPSLLQNASPTVTSLIGQEILVSSLSDQAMLVNVAQPAASALSSFTLNPGWAFPFLGRFTPSSGLASCFECGTLSERQKLVQHCPGRFASSSGDLVALGDKIGDMGASWVTTVVPRRSNFGSEWVPGLNNPLLTLTNEIVQRIKEITISKPRGSKVVIDWSPAIESICFSFFSPANLEKFLLLFWACWYPNCPMFHKPSFAAEASSPNLVGSMALIGACLSPDASDRAHANVWFNSMEEVAFNDDNLHDEFVVLSGSMTNRNEISKRLEAIQAAYLICLLQNWEGSKDSKQRIRRHRYTTLIGIARDFNFSLVTLKDLCVEHVSNFDWDSFVFLETLIRTGTFIFLLDSAFVVFHSSPPRMMLPELNIDLTCPDACFEATSAEECFILLYDSIQTGDSRSHLNISTTLELLCRPEVNNWEALRHLSILNMFTIVTALHYLIFHFHTSFTDLSQATAVDTGLERWIWLWHRGACLHELQLRKFPSCETMWKRVGFMQHAPEYYLLSRIMLERWKAKRDDHGSDGTSPSTWMNMVTKRPAPIKYDESEMGQFRELISSI
ncbi:hypothetical protein B0J13DRAFT_148897 [Dactylonectria estremocensis]|uniref:C2H2-type domain-containing protein n=1 Tax=Dactylonectria estremocensis TaxID=1079267 RepID=A0A9P9DW52_9HYPO|nr:hypothetical protein B0J13DRAFT_148897 [Dactylonectria estremocensis]